MKHYKIYFFQICYLVLSVYYKQIHTIRPCRNYAHALWKCCWLDCGTLSLYEYCLAKVRKHCYVITLNYLLCYKSFHLVSRNDDKKSNASATVLTGEIINKPGERNIFLSFQCISIFHTQRPKCLRKRIAELDTRGAFRTLSNICERVFLGK